MLPKQVKWFLCLSCLLISVAACQQHLHHKPKVEKGFLDLRLWHFEEQGSVALNGEWQLFWEQLFTINSPDSGFIYQTVPKMWNNNLWHHKPLPAYGYGTYQLKILLGKQHKGKHFGLKLNYVNSSYQLWIAGKKIGQVGIVATVEEKYRGNTNPSVYTFDSEKDTVELIVQVANYQDRFGGIIGSITIGTEEQIRTAHQSKTNYIFFILGVLVIMGLYHLSLFFFRQKNRSALHFGLLCMVIAARMLVTDEHVLTDFYPIFPYQIPSKISYLSFYLAVVCSTYFFHSVYPQDFSKKIRSIVGIVGGIFSVITLFTQLAFFNQFLVAFQLFTFLIIAYITYFIGLIIWKKREGSIVFALGVFFISSATVNDILHANETINTFVAAPLGLLLFISMQTILLSSLFSKAYKNVEDLSGELANMNNNLEEIVKKRTNELKSTNEELNQTLEELSQNLEVVNHQRHELSNKNIEITSSINYALRIQQTILPQLAAVHAILPKSFVLFMPRDIVSGDFYWFSTKDTKIILLAADCTGHGVPGAFMTMVSNQLLYEIIENKHITEADQILNHLHKSIRKVMKQDETGSREGMDLSLVVIDKERKTMEFAGAKNPIIYIQNQKLHHIKGDKISIGGEESKRTKTFQKHLIDISVPTTFYLFSDGYQDQFGGKGNRKMMLPRMKELFLEIHEKDMVTQKSILENTLKEWIEEGNEKQIDDILVIGCSLNC